MKRVKAASIVLGTALAFIPSALADSFGYGTVGSNGAVKFAIDVNQTSSGTGAAGAGAFAANDNTGTFAARNGSQFKSGNGGVPASNFDTISMSGNDGLGSDNLLNQVNSTKGYKGYLDRSGILVDFSGSEVNVLLGAFSGSEGINSGSSGHLNFGDKGGYRINDGVTKAANELAAGAATLAATPEPGSLFLLGTGLLCMALVLFRRGAKRPADS